MTSWVGVYHGPSRRYHCRTLHHQALSGLDQQELSSLPSAEHPNHSRQNCVILVNAGYTINGIEWLTLENQVQI